MATALNAYRLHFFFLLFVLMQTNHFAFCQAASYPTSEWSKKLSSKTGASLSGFLDILPAVANKDSAAATKMFNELEQHGNSSNAYFNSRLNLTKATYFHEINASKKFIKELLDKSINAAYETDNDSLIAAVSWQYALIMYWSGPIELASLYSLNAAEIEEKIGKPTTSNNYDLLASVLYATRDNEKCIYYTRKAVAAEKDTSFAIKETNMKRLNTIGLCWKRIGNYDSAFFYFDAARKWANKLGDNIWQSIVLGNTGQIYYAQQKYTLAKPMLESDYRFSKGYGEFGSASNSLQWVARINLMEGKKDSALMQVREAMELERRDRNPNYRQNIYEAAAEIFRGLGSNDSALKYSQLFNNLHDSLETAVADSRLEISRVRLENLRNALSIKNLTKEKQAETLKRNFSIAAIILITIIALLYVNRLRLKLRHKEQLAAERQKMADAEIAAAKEQLNLFTQNLVEKTNLIEQLQRQVSHRTLTLEQQELISNVSNLTILTESDWERFKTIFEKIYPGFFINLKEKVSDITVAEQRMAALTRLHLSINQIASILGISPNSVYKTKQRLRQRLNVDPEVNIEEVLTRI